MNLRTTKEVKEYAFTADNNSIIEELERLRVTRKDLLDCGYFIGKGKRSTSYLINEPKNSVVAFGCYRGEEKPINLTYDIYEKIQGHSILSKNDAPMLYIDFGIRETYLQNFALDVPEGMECDHRDHNRYNNISSNLRIATRKQNNSNRISTVRKLIKQKNGYIYKISVSASDIVTISKLAGKGFRELNSGKGRTYMISQPFSTPENAYKDMRVTNELLYGDYAYKMENDFSHEYGIHLIISCHCLGVISEEEMYDLNRAYWKEYWRKAGMPDVFAYAR